MLKSIMPEEKSGLVYSTDKILPRKEKRAGKASQTTGSLPQRKVYVRLDRKGRGGKSVTLIEGIQMPGKDGEAFLKQVKTSLGTGGALKNDVVEIQGDHRDAIIAMLQGMGYKPKRAGG
jgi:translation initiation factor 1